MNFLRNMFSKKENTPDSYTYSDFWKWFANNEKNFFASVKSRENIETEFFDKLAGTDQLRKQIIAGKTEDEIRKSWEPELKEYKEMRKKYLIYPDFN